MEFSTRKVRAAGIKTLGDMEYCYIYRFYGILGLVDLVRTSMTTTTSHTEWRFFFNMSLLNPSWILSFGYLV